MTAAPLARRMDGMKASEIRELLKLIDRPRGDLLRRRHPRSRAFPRRGRSRGLCATPCAIPPPRCNMASARAIAPLRAWIADADDARRRRPRRRKTSSSPPARSRGSIFSARRCSRRATRCWRNTRPISARCRRFPPTSRATTGCGSAAATARPASYTAARQAARSRRSISSPISPIRPASRLSLAEREAALTLARELGAVVIEDAAYRALRFAGEALPSLQRSTSPRSGGLERIRASSISARSPRRSRRGCGSAGSARRATLIAKLTLINQASALHVSSINQIAMFDIVQRRPRRRWSTADARSITGASATRCSTRWSATRRSLSAPCRRRPVLLGDAAGGRRRDGAAATLAGSRSASPSCPAALSIPTAAAQHAAAVLFAAERGAHRGRCVAAGEGALKAPPPVLALAPAASHRADMMWLRTTG